MMTDHPRVKRLLILGGTQEAYQLAEEILNEFDSERLTFVTSLAGVTRNPKIPVGEYRVGGFGGKGGLRQFMVQDKIDLLLNATHPYAVQMSVNAHQVAVQSGVPYLRLMRPAWQKVEGDLWIDCQDMQGVMRFLADHRPLQTATKENVLVTTGFRNLEVLLQNQDYGFVVRAIENPPYDFEHSKWTLLQERGPFSLEHEIELVGKHAIRFIISKNSGGEATYAKIQAARHFGIPILMIQRPAQIECETCSDLEKALEWLRQQILINGVTL